MSGGGFKLFSVGLEYFLENHPCSSGTGKGSERQSFSYSRTVSVDDNLMFAATDPLIKFVTLTRSCSSTEVVSLHGPGPHTLSSSGLHQLTP
jgi:hypothetical protein